MVSPSLLPSLQLQSLIPRLLLLLQNSLGMRLAAIVMKTALESMYTGQLDS